MSKTKTSPKLVAFDAARCLDNDEVIAEYMTAVLEAEDPDDDADEQRTGHGGSVARAVAVHPLAINDVICAELSPFRGCLNFCVRGLADLSTAAGVACDERPTRWASRWCHATRPFG